MARMIPDYSIYLNQECRWQGEREVYRALKDLTPSSWIAFHSVWLKNHEFKASAEADFVVLTDDSVIVLEVKGGMIHRDTGGRWVQTGHRSEPIIRYESPFQQASGASWALRSYLEKECGRKDLASGISWGTGVITPHCNPLLPEHDPEIDGVLLLSQQLFPVQINEFITRISGYWKKKNHISEALNEEMKESIVNFLIPEIRSDQPVSFLPSATEKEILNLTEQQIGLLDAVRDNPRILLKGGAGTGKTILAMEYARILSLQEKNVLIVCFNRLLSDYIRSISERDEDFRNVTVKTFKKLSEELKQKKNPNKWDFLIIDEGQDILSEEHLNIFNRNLADGISGGKWLITLDTEQDIHGYFLNTGDYHKLTEYSIQVSLNRNCRNTIPIIEYNQKLSLIRNISLSGIPGPYPIIDYYSDEKTKESRLKKHIEKELDYFKTNGEQDDIVILTRNKKDIPEDFFTPFYFRKDFREYRVGEKGRIQWSTIHAFKGLEASTIVIVGLEELESAESRSLFYVAASRARFRLIWIAPEKLAETVSMRLFDKNEETD